MPLIGVSVCAVAVWMLYHKLKHFHWDKVKAGLTAISLDRLALVVLLVIVSYVVLISYDWLVVRYLKLPVPLKRISLAALVAYVTSYNFGVLLGGTSVRYRFYRRWGTSLTDIARLVALVTLTSWLGLFAVAGVVFLFVPLTAPERLEFPTYVMWLLHNIHVLGLMLLLLVAGYIGLGFVKWRPSVMREHKLDIPPLRITLAQILIAGTDWALAALVLYVLVDPQTTADYPQVLGVYLLAMVASYISHVPGGVGLFELIVLDLLPHDDKDALLAALVAFRFLYLLLPLFAGLITWAVYELATRRTLGNGRKLNDQSPNSNLQ
ncbi:MAG: lysylphosphatidylglycerol synthase domain-containing protein [Planctomycetia bacterium]|nr:lysylphosphatidylglycerol synthase domain-containing protein [Planctomycetia bacterium]